MQLHSTHRPRPRLLEAEPGQTPEKTAMPLPSVSTSEGYESAGCSHRGGVCILFHHLPGPGQSRGKSIHRFRQLLRSSWCFCAELQRQLPATPCQSLPPRTGETDPATQPLGRGRGGVRDWGGCDQHNMCRTRGIPHIGSVLGGGDLGWFLQPHQVSPP